MTVYETDEIDVYKRQVWKMSMGSLSHGILGITLVNLVLSWNSTGNIEYFLIKERNSYLKRMSHTHLVSLK